MNINYLNSKLNKILLIAVILFTGIFSMFAPVYAACPSGTLTPAQKNDPDCISGAIGLDQINVSRIFPIIGVNDIVSTVATVILVLMVILFGIKVIIAGLKWVNNDAQDKSKKDAIKSLTNGVIGIAITFGAYFVVLAVRSIFGLTGGEQIVNCANIYYNNSNDFVQNASATSLNKTSETLKRCMSISGTGDKLSDDNKWLTFNNGVTTQCKQYVSINSTTTTTTSYPVTTITGIDIINPKELGNCFVDIYNKIP